MSTWSGRGIFGPVLPRVVRQHDGHAHAEHALSKSDVTDSSDDILPLGLAGLDHVAIRELHCLSTRATNFSGDQTLDSLRAALHHKPHDAIAGAAHSKASNEFVPQ